MQSLEHKAFLIRTQPTINSRADSRLSGHHHAIAWVASIGMRGNEVKQDVVKYHAPNEANKEMRTQNGR